MLCLGALLAQLSELARRAVFLHLRGGNAVFGIVVHLFEAAAIGLVDGELHAARNLFGVHDDAPVHVACGTTRRLRHAAAVAQKTFLVGIEDGHEGYFRQVEPFAQEVDAHQHLIDAGAQIFHDLHALQGVDVRVDVGRGDAQAQ